jgi:putative hydrolase of the HAD superfamily
MNKKLIVFDFSGTLAKEPTKNIPAFFAGLKKNGCDLNSKNQKEFLNFLKESLSKSMDRYALSQRVAAFFTKELDGDLIKLVQDNIVFPLFDDVKEVSSLPIKKAILTDASPFLIDLGRFEKSFSVFTPQITTYRKPDERAFQCVLDRCGAKAKETVMVGNDLYEDIIPAKNMGMTVILLDREGKIPEQKGIFKASSMREVGGYLEYLKSL